MRKKFRFLTVLAVCVMVLSCFSVTAFAYADDTEQNLPVTEATQPEQQPETTPAPEKPKGEPIDDEGNAYTRDLLYDKTTNKQFTAPLMMPTLPVQMRLSKRSARTMLITDLPRELQLKRFLNSFPKSVFSMFWQIRCSTVSTTEGITRRIKIGQERFLSARKTANPLSSVRHIRAW